MVFSSVSFLFYFLPAVILGYYLLRGRRLRNGWLLLASLVFYVAGGGAFVFVLLACIAVNYLLGLLAGQARDRRDAWIVGGLSVATNLSILGYYKYSNFLLDQYNVVGGVVGLAPESFAAVVLPIGISFYTFQAMSYVFDILLGVSRPKRNPLDFALYVAMFPQLIAGPIVRFRTVEEQLGHRRESFDDFARGALRFSWGLAKKILIADQVGLIAEAGYGGETEWTSATAWLVAVAYTVQLYFDFSAYSDMAIGLGRMFGFRFPENFARPYSAVSMTDFWRRWHMTLSTWFRDYLYIPLGGSRVSSLRMYANLALVFLLTGLWHGAAWTFVLWGAYHGALLIAERVTGLRVLAPERLAGLRRPATLLLVILGWILFRANSMEQAETIYDSLFAFSGWSLSPNVAAVLTNQVLAMLALGAASVLLPGGFVTGLWLQEASGRTATLARGLLVFGLLPFVLIYAMVQTFSPFLYYQF
ncbi:MAG: MBOAT family protein [Tistlia sp.]|uniref:MBOAT family protein n=1 Tax=Tistlia sp. TaxID=3057121 RepID=UPI0034A1EAB0